MENEQKILELLSKMSKKEINFLFDFAINNRNQNLAELALLLEADISSAKNIFYVNNLKFLELLYNIAPKELFKSYEAGEALCWACRDNNVRKVKLLLSQGIDPNRINLKRPEPHSEEEIICDLDYYCSTPLEASILQNNEELVKILTDAGEKATDLELDLAARHRASEKIIMLLIEFKDSQGYYLDYKDSINGLIWVICNFGYADALVMLLSKLSQEESIRLIDFCINWATNEDLINTEPVEKIIDAITIARKVGFTQEQDMAICNLQTRIKEAKKQAKRQIDQTWIPPKRTRRKNLPFVHKTP